MLSSSAKNKGRRFEHFVNHCIEEAGLGRAVRVPGSGSGKHKGDSYNNLPFLFEMKNEKQWHWPNVDQAKRQAKEGNWDPDKWVLVIRDPRYPEFHESYAVIDLHQFLELLKKNKEPVIKQPDKSAKYAFERARAALREAEKHLE